MTAVLRADTGAALSLDVNRWRAEIDATEAALLATLVDPVLDIGCGPGRVVAALTVAGRPALGIDSAPAAVAEARRCGAPVLCRSVFDRLPGEGRWSSVVLLDGNVGIGGDPDVLLGRVARLLGPGGRVVVEVGPPGTATEALSVRVEPVGGGQAGPWFPWATVGADAFVDLASSAGLVPAGLDEDAGRWFASATNPAARRVRGSRDAWARVS